MRRDRFKAMALVLVVGLVAACDGTGSDTTTSGPDTTDAGSVTTTTTGDTTTTTSMAAVDDADLIAPDRIGLADAPNVLTFQTLPPWTHQAPTESHANGMQELFVEWAKRNPDWRIDLEIVPVAQALENQTRLLEDARVGRGPDCALVNSPEVHTFADLGLLQPVTDYFSSEEIDSLFPYVRAGLTGSDGELYAYWTDTDLRVLFRRTDLVPEAPQTWDELRAAALSAVEQDPDIDGYLFNGGRWNGTVADFLPHFWAQGGELTNEGGEVTFDMGADREYMLASFEFVSSLVDEGAAPQRVVTISAYSDFNAAAEAGTVAMFTGLHAIYDQLQGSLPPEEATLWAVSPIPAREAGTQATTSSGWTIGALTTDPEKVAMCMDLVRTVYMGPFNEITGRLPTSSEIFDQSERFATPPYDEFREMLAHGNSPALIPNWSVVANEFAVAVGDVLTGAISPEQAVDDTASRIREATSS